MAMLSVWLSHASLLLSLWHRSSPAHRQGRVTAFDAPLRSLVTPATTDTCSGSDPATMRRGPAEQDAGKGISCLFVLRHSVSGVRWVGLHSLPPFSFGLSTAGR